MVAPTPKYPEDAVQAWVDGSWWERDTARTLCRGRLLWAFVPHVEQEPVGLFPEGRALSRDHGRALYKIGPIRVGDRRTAPTLPVAGMPDIPGEVRAVYRAKRRPVVVLGGHAADRVDRSLTRGMANYQTTPTVLVAPYYGATKDGSRGGVNPEFLARIRRAMYPQYAWDLLPVQGSADGSVLMLNQLQPIGTGQGAHELTEFRLSENALAVMDQWLGWLLTGQLDSGSVLADIRLALSDPANP